MPIYEYICDGCGHKFEELVRNDKEEAQLTCPQCGQGKPARQLSVFAARDQAPAGGPPPGGCGGCGQQGVCPYSD